ncbi:MAG: DnaD domain protein [Ruminococcus sp.]|nr:DnaD domain protein [Ruminococcus sp.]
MSVKINLGAWRSVFAVPSKIVDEGLKFADGVKLKVLLYVLRNSDSELDLNEISKATGVNVTDIPEALDYWVSREVLQKNDSEYAPVDSKKEIKPENNSVEEIKSVETISKDVEEQKQRMVVAKPQKPDYVFTSQRLAVDEDLKILVGEAQTMLGKTLSNSDIATLLMLKDTCGLRLDVILMLIQYCVSIDKGNMRTVEKIGISWADAGINSVEAADNRIAQANHSSKCFSIVSSVFGLKNVGSPTKKQLEYTTKWVGEWKFSPEMLREAYERCVDSKGELKFNYIDGILKKWDAQGIKNMEDLKASESKPKQPAGRKKTSYDINELEKIDTLDFID